ncbi:tyrosine-type recombinase/integrase [Rothia endophytica]|uniref:tyrosine-type recombinase/integrase n=1 Tax=Rothia endophytica TaxID=1324766 RepID=UPI001F2C2C40|nr:site-specific integrase [Rothia endophytica]
MVRAPLPLGTHGNITYYQHENGNWQARARYRDADGITRTVKRNGATKNAAMLKLKAHLAERQHVTTAANLTPASTVKELAGIWWEEFQAKDRATSTQHRYRYDLDRLILPSIGNLKIRECTVGTLSAFLKTVSNKNGAQSARVAKNILKGMFDLATAYDAAPRNPVKDVTLAPVKKKETVALEYMDVLKLRQSLTGEVREALEIMLGTGCRVGEVLALQWADLDLSDSNRARVSINSTLTRDTHGRYYRQEHTKNKRTRSAFLPPFVAEMLIRRRDTEIPAHATTTAWATPEMFVFPSSTGTAQDPNNFRRKWREQVKGTDFEKVTPHNIRSTVATFLERNTDLTTASLQLGHSDTAVTARHYVKRETEAPDSTAVLELFGREVSS